MTMALNNFTDIPDILRMPILQDLKRIGMNSGDLLIYTAIVLAVAAIYILGWWSSFISSKDLAFDTPPDSPDRETQNLIDKITSTASDCIVFYGSQSGNAEDFANRLAQDGKRHYDLDVMVLDLEDYDFENLDQFPSNKVAIFVLATYGEGEPTDNAVDFHRSITSSHQDLSDLRYVLFGLGNSTYEHYNLMGRSIDKTLSGLGALRIGGAGEGDDGKGTLEEDFLTWKDDMWKALADHMGLKRQESSYKPVFSLEPLKGVDTSSPTIYLGEPSQSHLSENQQGWWDAQHPYIASVLESRELFTSSERNCLHLEIGIPGMSYETGDHVAISPSNPNHEVDRFLRILGLTLQRDQVFEVRALEMSTKPPFSSPTTLDTIARYQLEICAPVSRQFISTLVQFAPNEASKAAIEMLAKDRILFNEQVRQPRLNIGTLLESTSAGVEWSNIPFSAFIEGLPRLRPRYYSISSSSLAHPSTVSITAVVESQEMTSGKSLFKGVASNYLLALKQVQNGEAGGKETYDIRGPRGIFDGIKMPLHIRRSNFRLPRDHRCPLILIGPGTGVAPMRAFIQERAELARRGQQVGKSLLFFGCRRRDEDYIYESEWLEHAIVLGQRFEVVTAFSREGTEKKYVQSRLWERADEVDDLLRQNGHIYVCGNAASMAHDVKAVLVCIISDQRRISLKDAEGVLQTMKSSAKYQEDVW